MQLQTHVGMHFLCLSSCHNVQAIQRCSETQECTHLTKHSPTTCASTGMLYCMEYLAANLDWLQEQLSPLAAANSYFIIDCPGQVGAAVGCRCTAGVYGWVC